MALPKIFKNINDQVSAVDPNGDTMKGAIRFNEGRGQLNAYSWDDGTTYLELYAKKNSDNKRTILQLNSAPDENGNSAIRLLFRDANGTVTGLSNLYGEHFKPTPADIGALSLSGGRMTGNIIMDNESIFQGYIPRKNPDGGGWAYAPFNIRDKANEKIMNLGVYGSQNNLAYIYLGTGEWNATNNVRIYPSGTLTVASGVTDYSSSRCRNISTGTSGSPVGNGDMFVKY